jgi:hypothetical protein
VLFQQHGSSWDLRAKESGGATDRDLRTARCPTGLEPVARGVQALASQAGLGLPYEAADLMSVLRHRLVPPRARSRSTTCSRSASTAPPHAAIMKLFGNSFLGQSGQAEGAVGELAVEGLETYDGEDDVVDAIEVTAVPGSRDSPVLHVGDRLFDDETYDAT